MKKQKDQVTGFDEPYFIKDIPNYERKTEENEKGTKCTPTYIHYSFQFQ